MTPYGKPGQQVICSLIQKHIMVTIWIGVLPVLNALWLVMYGVQGSGTTSCHFNMFNINLRFMITPETLTYKIQLMSLEHVATNSMKTIQLMGIMTDIRKLKE